MSETSSRLESILAGTGGLPVGFLRLGLERADAVGRVQITENGKPVSWGTGFLVAPGLVLTSHSMVPDAETAAKAHIEFDYREEPGGSLAAPQRAPFDPGRVFVSVAKLDFAIVAIDSAGDRRAAERAPIVLRPRPGIIIPGESVNIVHHARGEPQELLLRGGAVTEIKDQWVHYTGETGPGSAGAPVFSDQWELVGMHHAQVAGGVREGVLVSSLLKELIGLGELDLLHAIRPGAGLVPEIGGGGAAGTPADRRAVTPDTEDPGARDTVFLCYARADQEEGNWKERLDRHLRAMSRSRNLVPWHDGRIAPGVDWRSDIAGALERSRAAVLLVGPEFLLSEFITTRELPALLRAQQERGLRIFPVITNYCTWSDDPELGRMQAVNDPEEPLESLAKPDQNKALVEVAQTVVAAVKSGTIL